MVVAPGENMGAKKSQAPHDDLRQSQFAGGGFETGAGGGPGPESKWCRGLFMAWREAKVGWRPDMRRKRTV